jgi:hypothetical protein
MKKDSRQGAKEPGKKVARGGAEARRVSRRHARLAREFAELLLTPFGVQMGERLAIMVNKKDAGGWCAAAIADHALHLISQVAPKVEESEFAQRVRAVLGEVGDLLIAKNKAYGDSALNPVGIFARGNAEDLIRVRIDDKLSRIRNAPEAFGEDAVMDLLGYLVLLKLAKGLK